MEFSVWVPQDKDQACSFRTPTTSPSVTGSCLDSAPGKGNNDSDKDIGGMTKPGHGHGVLWKASSSVPSGPDDARGARDPSRRRCLGCDPLSVCV